MGFRTPFLLAPVSLLCGVLLFFVFGFFSSNTAAPSTGAGYAVLSVDESQKDRYIRESLYNTGHGNFISESSMEVPLDDFGALRMVPLDSFHYMVEYFDPRDSGFAARLRSFFVRDGKRFFFLPLDNISGRRADELRNYLSVFLADEQYNLEFLARDRPFFPYFAFLAIASLAALCFSRSRRLFVFQVPVLLAFGWAASSGFLLAAILAGIWELLREPLGELSAASLRQDKRNGPRLFNYAGSDLKNIRERLRPFQINLILVVVFTLFFLIFSALVEFSFFLSVAGFLTFFLVRYLAQRSETERAQKRRHILFTPVPLLPLRLRTFSLFPFLLPFALGAMLVMLAPLLPPLALPVLRPFSSGLQNLPAFSPSSPINVIFDPQYFVSTEEYQSHISFQRSFSLRPLDEPMDPAGEAIYHEGFLRYYLGEDGLIAGGSEIGWPRAERSPAYEGPPFPLEKLMEFLINYDRPGVSVGPYSLLNFKEWISILMIFAVCMLDFFRPRVRYGKKLPGIRDERIAA